MIQIQTKIKIPFIWGKSVFNKKNWSQINLIVGPNGSGKTLLSEELALQFKEHGYQVTFLHQDRESQNENYMEILKSNLEIRQKIENVLSNMFAKSIQFEEKDDGRIVPVVVNKTWNLEYSFQDKECHGLKGILTLLVSLYSSKSGVLIVDEPELHLHPQFQLFFMNEIRKVVQSDKNKIFFLITHSPFFIDLKTPEDLIGVVVCHINRSPTFIEKLSRNDYELFRRFLPRFNTYHKQFFFSDNQIFVEGYTDQQIFNKLLPYVENRMGSAGTGIIDVGGKDELGVFFKVCSLLGTDGRIISDLDSLFQSKLREVVCQDERCAKWLEKQKEKQFPFYKNVFTRKELNHPVSLELLIRKLEHFLIQVGNSLCDLDIDAVLDEELCILLEKLHYLKEKHEKVEDIDTFKTVILQGVLHLDEKIASYLPLPLAQLLPLIKNLTYLIAAASEAARVYILPDGCIEHYYRANKVLYMPVSGKDRLFHSELEYMSKLDEEEIRQEYSVLIYLLEKSCSHTIVL
ncbi:MAG: AAA family ATPase [Treponemataceae bacterium]|nr:AAA family ATPase [Treponemataceae bacterium]